MSGINTGFIVENIGIIASFAETQVTYYCKREKDLVVFYSQEDNFKFCNNINMTVRKSE